MANRNNHLMAYDGLRRQKDRASMRMARHRTYMPRIMDAAPSIIPSVPWYRRIWNAIRNLFR